MLRVVHVTIEGISPLIVNRFHEEAQEEADSGTHFRKERLSPEEDVAMRLYPQNSEGPTFPAENIRQSIISASSRTKIGRRSATTDVAAGIYLFPEMLHLIGDWHIDSRAVVIKAANGARVTRHRPMFNEWSIRFDLQVDTDLIDERTMRKITEDAGRLVGVGDFRPAKKGPYGRFAVTAWETDKK